MNVKLPRCELLAGRSLACILLWVAGLGLLCSPPAGAQEVKIWEFSPYEVEIWVAFDASLTVSEAAREKFVSDVEASLKRTFRAAWRTQLSDMPARLTGHVARNFESLTLDDLTHNELILVVATKHPDTKTVRTFEAAAAGLSQVYVTADAKQLMDESLAKMDLPAESPSMQLSAKLAIEEGGLTAIKQKLLNAEIAAALIPRSALNPQEVDIRALITPLPWQSEMLFRERDKLFFLLVGMQGDAFTFKACELDCPMQFIGTSFESSTSSWQEAARKATSVVVRAFAPIARVEDAEAKTATIRQRAGGLIVDEQNPARIRVGDVLQPIVRRDDRNGIPTLLEPLSFTFAAVTESDGVKMGVNVYTYSGGPGLQGRKNRRTQRVLLRVRPRYTETDLRIAVRGDAQRSQAGCFVYNRDWMTEEFVLLGRTDWRGRLTIPVPLEDGAILPEEIRKQRFQAKLAAQQAAQEKEEAEKAKAAAAAENGEVAAESPAPAAVPAPVVAEVEEIDPKNDAALIPLNYPLLQIYIKSGDTVLAKLPMVPGLQPLEIAELPDDSHRLQAEAFVRGFQGEILDLIGLRNLLAARVRLYVKDKELKQAEGVLDELRGLKTYNEMADELSRIQNRMLKEAGDNVPYAAKVGIDRMFQTTRDMLQKYLQDNLVVNAEREVQAAR